ncbi:electron transport complex subunit RsxG [Vibrio astriarenae]|jgi:electron transport complex protein RnfG|uniref:Ion-translocating oxidoreductase complex subunit G n=1 Tax=Vibrio agarivorans TaxID=153622 RepID=A0ABT7Y0Y2_9VIBR|nr:electron transport complex subunit RsxG [Vibrio agarivorans]MDN2481708.1 electron transport complex subunit RsxG [Vibrio agarivorans]
MLNAIKNNALILVIFACASTGLVAVTNLATKDTIAEQQQKQLLRVLNQVIPTRMHDNNLYQACTLVTDPLLGTNEAQPAYLATLNGQPSAVAIEAVAPDGYNGTIRIVVATDMNGKILGSRVLAHQETPGLGDKIDLRVSEWILAFAGQFVTESNLDDWKVRKDGGKFDQFTGATITPRAVVSAVKNATLYLNQHREALFAQPANCGAAYD